ncbi:MAG: DUF1653 domain-containing protein [Candidatus Peribacteraceae bacterium]|nr:DUF1653 domain-containing protein [Candidatus Peribacteraceae bacterium]
MPAAPLPGQRYRHYKGGRYEVVAVATLEATHEPLVVYRAEADGAVWARPLSQWSETVEHEGQTVARFFPLD